MCYIVANNFSLRDFAVSRAIKELHDKHKYISQQMIADYIGCDISTVQRSIAFMKESGLIKIHCGHSKRGGFIYEYIGTR